MQKMIKINFAGTLHYIYGCMCVWIKPDLLMWTFRYKIKKKQNMLKNFSMGNEASSFSFMFS